MKRGDPHRALLRALTACFPQLLIFTSRSEPWASVTFTGARHVIVCAEKPELKGIEDVEFTLGGHMVADIVTRPDGDRTIIEALTIEAA